MIEEKCIKDALDLYVESLEEEQKSNKLIENSNKTGINAGMDEEAATGLEKLRKILKKIIELICVGESVKINTDIKELKLSVYGGDLGIAIGKDGKNMQALEYIINLICKRKNLVNGNVVIDIKDYRQNRIKKIKKEAREMANKVVKEGKEIALQPMCSFERKIVHNILSEFEGINTKSKYEEPNRRIVIYPLKKSK
ncbi:MAG: KH domain-containing protein [Actinomycetota bacterium]|nr:KH domain-containing protein [Actinomycetota bacterium]